ncbi:MAG: FAD-dependent oxidoreductase [Polyangiaceae bacterium]
MVRTPLFSRLLDTLRVAGSPRSAREALDEERARLDRRAALKIAALGAASLATGTLVGCAADAGDEADRFGRASAPLVKVNANVGIVGAGIAGLACAYELKRAGAIATLHDANDRVGGRIWSMGGLFPGQTIERGAELIDTPHKTMIGYAREFGLALEDVAKPVRDTRYHFGGQAIAESTMVDEYRVLVDAMRDDLRRIGTPTADAFTPFEQQLDRMSLREYLDSRGAPPNIKKLLNVAYTIEYGRPSELQSCLAFLLFIKASRQSKLRLWGNFSDERYHVIGGNQQIVDGLAARLPGQIQLGRRLVAVQKLSSGRIELTFKEGTKTVTATHDAVVLALPFNLLREVTFGSSVGLTAPKRFAIQNTVYGTNAKLMVGFTGRPWVEVGANGAVYTDMPYLQCTWEANPSQASESRGVITDYTGGALGVSMGASSVQKNAENFLSNFDVVFPGANARARRDAAGRIVAHLEHWPSNPLARGSYTANAPGYFTTISGNEAKSQGNLYFAGETTDAFESWQGFMEGGALSGIRAMKEIVRDFG